jgi:thymidine phosphorylase
VTVALGAEMLLTGGLAASVEDGRARMERAIEGGAAAERFAAMVAALGGPRDLMERPEAHLAAAEVVRPVPAPRAGLVAGIDNRALGLAVVALGGGRMRAADPVDHAVGLTGLAGLGAAVSAGDPLAFVHARTDAEAEAAARTVNAAYEIAEDAPARGPLIARRIAGSAA